ncbi:MAG: hypothetical protein Unbinned1606contig1000_27 [Prokaryotic dsDNA virus sp.]|nr:MAG: hypothetical protein Unbinned1606contig1000_27 [Prokaryotic dsDNA virus sp.]
MNLVQVAHHIDPKALELVRELGLVAAGVVIFSTVVLALSRRK